MQLGRARKTVIWSTAARAVTHAFIVCRCLGLDFDTAGPSDPVGRRMTALSRSRRYRYTESPDCPVLA
jgi:hypothetical protein